MAFGYLVVALLAAAVAVFALQNSGHTSLRFLMWTVEGVPVAGVALASLAVGLVVVALPLWIRGWRWQSRARSAEARLMMLEKTLAERDRAAQAGPIAPHPSAVTYHQSREQAPPSSQGP
jgi:uncharacterized integral membrane protein